MKLLLGSRQGGKARLIRSLNSNFWDYRPILSAVSIVEYPAITSSGKSSPILMTIREFHQKRRLYSNTL